MNGKYAIAIDSFQKIRQIGYLGNPASFTGTYVSYLAHEALYFNHEQEIFSNTGEVYDEFTIFERTHYTGGWAASIDGTIDIPEDLSNYNKLEVELLSGQESFRIKSFVKSNVWAVLPNGKSSFKKGQIIDCFLHNHSNKTLA